MHREFNAPTVCRLQAEGRVLEAARKLEREQTRTVPAAGGSESELVRSSFLVSQPVPNRRAPTLSDMALESVSIFDLTSHP